MRVAKLFSRKLVTFKMFFKEIFEVSFKSRTLQNNIQMFISAAGHEAGFSPLSSSTLNKRFVLGSLRPL